MTTFIQNNSKVALIIVASMIVLAALADNDFLRTLSLGATLAYFVGSKGRTAITKRILSRKETMYVALAIVGIGIFSGLHIAYIAMLSILLAAMVIADNLHQAKAVESA